MSMKNGDSKPAMTRREMLTTMGTMAAGAVAATQLVEVAFGDNGVLAAQATPHNVLGGVDRVDMLKGKTYLNGWVGYGAAPGTGRGRNGGGRGGDAPPAPTGPAPTAQWTMLSGPGTVTFADPKATVTTATFSK